MKKPKYVFFASLIFFRTAPDANSSELHNALGTQASFTRGFDTPFAHIVPQARCGICTKTSSLYQKLDSCEEFLLLYMEECASPILTCLFADEERSLVFWFAYTKSLNSVEIWRNRLECQRILILNKVKGVYVFSQCHLIRHPLLL